MTEPKEVRIWKEWKPCEITEVKITVPCKDGNHEVVLKVEKYFDSMRQDSDFAILCDDPTIQIVYLEDEEKKED